MIKSFKLYVSKEKPCLTLLEYGDDGVSLDEIIDAIKSSGIEEFDSNAIEEALSNGVLATIQISDTHLAKFPGTCWITVDEEKGVARANLVGPKGSGEHIEKQDILDELKSSGCGDFFILDDILIRNIETHKNSNKSAVFNVAERRDANIEIEIETDQKSAYLSYHRSWGGSKPTLADATAKLSEVGVVFGIDEQRINEILTNNQDALRKRIANALEPVDGTDAKLEYLFDAFHKKAGPRIREDDTADFRDLSLFENVEKDAPLVRRTPSTPGEDGTDVTGKPIKATSGKDTNLPKGKNTQESAEDPNLLVADKPGAPKLVGGKVLVEDVFIVGDVDFSTGNIDFNGNVFVKGVVKDGFIITAEGDITCNDTVEGGDLKAGGSIFLKHGIKGLGKSVIEAGGDILARFIERSKVLAGGSVIVDEALIHSDTSATDTVMATNKKGCIFGGHIKAGNLLKASYIGSEMAANTVIEVGVTPHIRQRLADMKVKIEKEKKEFENDFKNLEVLSVMRERGSLPPDREKMYQNLSETTIRMREEIDKIEMEIESLQKELQHCAEGRIEAQKIIYPGVMMTIKNAKLTISEPMENAIFIKEGPDIILSADIAE